MSSLTDLAQRWRDDRNRSGIDIDVRTIPAWLLRLTLVVAVFVGGIVAHGELIPALVATIVLAAFPHFGLFAVAGALAVASTLWREPELVTSSVLTLTLHLAYVSVALIQDLPLRGGVEGRLVLRTAASFGVIQVIAQVLVALAFAARGIVAPMPWVTVAAMAVLVLAVALVLRWLARTDDDTRPWAG